MNREIKFRGYSSDMGEWYFGSFIDNSQSDFDCYIQDDDGHFTEVERETVGQYTGLKDKNGKEIYEGDILDTHAQFDDIYIRKVVYKDCGLYLEPGTGFTLTKGNERHFEVIGNIHENPALVSE